MQKTHNSVVHTPGMWDAFAVTAPGLEHIVARELESLGIRPGLVTDGGVEFAANREALYTANLHLRAASRVIVRLASFRATSFAELERRARRVPWERVLPRGSSVTLRVTCRKSRLYHSGGVAERLMRDLTDRTGAVPGRAAATPGESPDDEHNPGQLFIVRMDRDHCTISADSSGAHLHQRGYRTAITEAPMRETLAAALVLASGWDARSPFVDPFCGSGTIPIEAAMIAARLAPGRNRTFRFAEWPDHDSRTWASILRKARQGEVLAPTVPIVGSDRSVAAIRAAESNASRAGTSQLVRFERRDVRSLVPPPGQHGWLVTNPPYGVRLGDRSDLRLLMESFGEVLEDRFAGWSIGVLVAHASAAAPLPVPLRDALRTTNGGLSVRFLVSAAPGK